MNTFLRTALNIIRSLNLIIAVGDNIEDDIISGMDGKAKIISYNTPPPSDEPELDDLEGDEPELDDLEGDEPGGDEPEPDEPKDDLGKINKTLGTEFKTLDDLLKSDVPARLKEYGAVKEIVAKKEAEVNDLRAQLADLEAQVDPLSHFASPEEYIRQQLLKKYPEFDPAVLSKVVGMKEMDKADPVTILKLHRMLKDGDIYRNESEAMDSIKDDFEYDPDTSLDEHESRVRNKILKAAKEARAEFKALQQDISLPSKDAAVADRQKRYDEIAGKWTPYLNNELSDQLKKIEFKAKDGTTEFEFKVDEKFIEAVKSAQSKIATDLAKKGIEFSKEAADAVAQEYLNYYKSRNLDRIARAYANKLVKDMDQQAFDLIHNPRPKRRDDSPRGTVKDSRAMSKAKAEAEILKDMPN